MPDFTPTAFLAEAQRILTVLDALLTSKPSARFGRDLRETLKAIQDVEVMPEGMYATLSPAWCHAARDVIESLRALRSEIVQSSDKSG
jgi:hypothetical protein